MRALFPATTLLWILCAAVVFADDASDLEKLNGLSAVAPKKLELPSGAASPLLIDAHNIAAAQDLVIPELINPVRNGDVVLEAIAKLPFEWRYDQSFRESSGDLSLDKSGVLSKVSGLKRGLAFPAFQDLNKELLRAENSAQAMLWNVNSIWWSMGAFRFDFQLLRLAADGPDLKLGGALKRLYPKNIDQEDKTEQLFRELVKFESPAALKGLSYLTFRLYTAEEDFLWLYSVAIQASRELTGPNRTDTILRSGVSLDDFLVWSGNINTLRPKFSAVSQKLVPFRYLKVIKASGPDAEKCQNVFMSGTATSVEDEANWNFESEKYPHAAKWLPTGSVFVPRDLIKLDLISTDPFSLYGRQVLYIDKESMLPAYKIVFDRSGRHWKTIIGSFALIERPEGNAVIPVYQVVLDAIRNQATVIEFTRAHICGQYSSDLKLQDFDPHHLGPPAADGAAKGKSRETRKVATPTVMPEEPADGIID